MDRAGKPLSISGARLSCQLWIEGLARPSSIPPITRRGPRAILGTAQNFASACFSAAAQIVIGSTPYPLKSAAEASQPSCPTSPKIKWLPAASTLVQDGNKWPDRPPPSFSSLLCWTDHVQTVCNSGDKFKLNFLEFRAFSHRRRFPWTQKIVS